MRWLLLVAALSAACDADKAEPRRVIAADAKPPQPVRIDSAVVEAVTPSTLCIQNGPDDCVVVVPRDPAMLIGIEPGWHVDVDGELRAVPHAKGELARLGAHPMDQARLARAPHYIHAIRIAAAGAAPPSS